MHNREFYQTDIHTMQQLPRIFSINFALFILLSALFLPVRVTAQYSQGAQDLKASSELFDERGYAQNGALNVDGKLAVSHSNGNVSYIYQIAQAPISSYPVDVTLSYCGSVSFTAFKDYDGGNPTYPYRRWNKFSQNRPAWVVGVAGFAVQVLSSNSMFHCDPARFSGATRYDFNDSDMVWMCDGYDYTNRMENLLDASESAYGYVDHIRLLRADGSILELVNKKTVDQNQLPENRTDLYTGTYYVNEANAKGFGVVSYDTSVNWADHHWAIVHDALPSGPYYPYQPRILRYYDGSLEYVFREWPAPFGTNAYAGRGLNPTNRFGNIAAGPTIFYLEQINSNSGTLLDFKRSRQYFPRDVVTLNDGNIYDPVFTRIYDSTTGRALMTDFGEISIGYGDVGMTVQAYGRTTKVRFAKVTPSGNGWSTTSMPLASRGYFTKTAAALAELPETGATSGALYDSYLGYVTEIVDPEGRVTKFEYEPYTRKYVNYDFPIENQPGHDVSLTCKNYRLNKVIEPTCYYTIAYAPGDFMGGGIAGRIDNTRNATLRPTDGQLGVADNHAFWQNNVASYVKKFDFTNTLLTTLECEYFYTPSVGFHMGTHRAYDNITGKVRRTTQQYSVEELTDPVPYVPIPHFTAPTVSTDSGDVVTVTTTAYQHPAQTKYLWLPASQTTVVAGITKSKQTFSYQYDTTRTYGGNATLTAKFGLDIKKQIMNTLDPVTDAPLFRDTTEYTYFPLIDTNLTKVDTFMLKFQMMTNYINLRDSGLIKVPYQFAIFDPRVLAFRIDSTVGRNTLPPIFGLVKRQIHADAAGSTIGGKEFEYTGAYASPHYINDLMYRGTLARDSIISAAGMKKVLGMAYTYTRGFGHNLLSTRMNANKATERYYYESYSSPKIYTPSGGFEPRGVVKHNDNSARDTLLPHGGYFSFAFEKPLINESYVRKYKPSKVSGEPPVDTIFQLNQYSYYGQVTGVVDYNGNYSQYRYDKNGRLLALWAPLDFPRRDTVDTVRYEGTETVSLMGYTKHTYTIDTVHCDSATLYPGPAQQATLENFYAGHPTSEPPFASCPCPPQEGTREKSQGRTIQENCNVRRPYVNNDYYTGMLSYGIDSASPIRNADVIDSLYLALHPIDVTGECVFMTVEIPQFSFTKHYLFNCDGGSAPSGTIFAGNEYLQVDLADIKANIQAMQPGDILNVKFKVSTAGGGIEFVNGEYAEDTRPQLVVKGKFKRPSDQVDYTLAYSYRDDSLKTTVSAKVDDIRHTSNHYDLAALHGSTIRRDTTIHYFGRGGNLVRSHKVMKGDAGRRVDSALYAIAGTGARMKTTDQEGDTNVVQYDALGRPIKLINADGTYSTITYLVGDPTTFGIATSDQQFYGFCSAKITASENGTKSVEYYDALDRLRRQVVDSGSSISHLNLTTRYNYDTDGHLSQVVTPKGDTIFYWYDLFGRVQQKKHPDLGIVSYSYDNVGNVRYSQNQEQANKGRLLFNEYDDLNRLVVVGEAVIGNPPNRPTFENDGYEGQGGWLYSHVYTPDIRTITKKEDDRSPVILSAPVTRVTDILDATVLHISSGANPPYVTANPTLWKNPQSTVPSTWAPAASLYSYCTLQPDTMFLNETTTPLTPLLRHPVTYYLSPSGPGATFQDFEDLAKYPHFARMAISYDTLPYRSGPIWGAFPSHEQWDSLTPFNKVRNTKGRQAAVAYREHGGAPWHYMVSSYDERGRVEALLRWTENIGFDAVYYSYNAMNQVTSVRVADFYRQYHTWYGVDGNGRIDSIWSELEDWRTGLVTGPFTGQMWHYSDTIPRPQNAEIVYTYTKMGKVDTMRYPKINVFVDYAYNHRKWLDSIAAYQVTNTIQPPDTAQLWTDVLRYDLIGQITSQTSTHNTSWSLPTQAYNYDHAQRLTSWVRWPDSTKYSYDAVGNRSVVQWSDAALPPYTLTTQSLYGGTVGGSNRLALVETVDSNEQIVAPGKYTFAYDANGAQVMKTHYPLGDVGGDNREYVYSYRGLMRRIATGAWDTMKYEWRYAFSPAGEREQKRMYVAPKHDSVVNYPWTYYLLGRNGQQLAVYHGQETSKTGACGDAGRRVYMYPSEYMTYGIGGTANLTTLPSHQKRYVIPDHLGSARIILDSGGVIVGRYDYTPSGDAMAVSGAVTGTRKSYIDRERDIESGLLNTGVRQLDGDRFTSIDPLWEKYMQWNPYGYSNADPLRLKDANGATVSFADETSAATFTALYHASDAATRAKYDALIKSTVEYNIGLSRPPVAPLANATTSYNFDDDRVEISIRQGINNPIGALGDELATAYQFETGQIGYEKGGAALGYDMDDETETKNAGIQATNAYNNAYGTNFQLDKAIQDFQSAQANGPAGLILYYKHMTYSFHPQGSVPGSRITANFGTDYKPGYTGGQMGQLVASGVLKNGCALRIWDSYYQMFYTYINPGK